MAEIEILGTGGAESTNTALLASNNNSSSLSIGSMTSKIMRRDMMMDLVEDENEKEGCSGKRKKKDRRQDVNK